jgi:hypothetical protein
MLVRSEAPDVLVESLLDNIGHPDSELFCGRYELAICGDAGSPSQIVCAYHDVGGFPLNRKS